MGLLKKVCSKKPEHASAPPRMAALTARGRRICQMTLASRPLAPGPAARAPSSSAGLMPTDPMHRFAHRSVASTRLASTMVTTNRRLLSCQLSVCLIARLSYVM